jgi:phosphatidylglycerophosphate synthase
MVLMLAATLKPSSSNGLVMAYSDLAFKSVEIEDLADVYFFRPVGWVVARGAQKFGLTPTALTVIGILIGICGGALLYNDRLGLIAFAILILHGFVDSADGQLARMTGRVSEFGRVLDGVSGYVTHVAIYLSIAAGLVHRGGPRSTFGWMLLAGIATAIHAGLHEYHRNAYASIVTEKQLPAHHRPNIRAPFASLFSLYVTGQRWLIGPHTVVEATIRDRALAGPVLEEDRTRYRACFRSLARALNFLGDNTRFYAIGVLACVHRIDLFFPFVLGPMNLALIILWLWQRRADERFLATRPSVNLGP